MQAIFHSAQAENRFWNLCCIQISSLGLASCLAFQKLKLGNGSQEGTLKTRNGGKNTSSGCSWLHGVCPLSFHPWIVVSYYSQIKITETYVWAKVIDKTGCFFPSLPPYPPLFFQYFLKYCFWQKTPESGRGGQRSTAQEELGVVPSDDGGIWIHSPWNSSPALRWEGAQPNSSAFPEGRGKPSGFSMCPSDPLGRTQNAY